MSLKSIFLDIFENYQTELQKNNKTSNPYFKKLRETIQNDFGLIAVKHGYDIKPLGGQSIMPSSPYISFLASGHKTSKGIYPVYHFNLNNGQIYLDIGDADENEPDSDLVHKISEESKAYLLEFSDQNIDGYPRKIYQKEKLDDSELISDLDKIISVHKECLKKFNEDIQEYLQSDIDEFSSDILKIDQEFSEDDLKILLEEFFKWYENDPHKDKESVNEYEKFSKDYFFNLTESEFVNALFEFAKQGGKIQSGGERTAGKFKEMMESNSDEFQQHILSIFNDDFSLIDWWQKTDKYTNFGRGIRSIFLHRVFPDKYAVFNNKSLKVYKLIGLYPKRIPKGTFDYQLLIDSAKKLVNIRPSDMNFYRADAFTHFLIGTKDGKNALKKIIGSERYWKIAPGEKAFLWEDCKKKQIICFGWNDLGDLRQYETKEELLDAIKEKNIVKGVQQSFKADEIWNFKNIKRGDYVLANNGISGIKGFGQIRGEYKYDPSLEYHNSYPVDWYDVEYREQNLPGVWAFSTVLELNKEEFRKYETGEIDEDSQFHMFPDLIPQNLILYGPPGTGKTYQTVNYSVSIIDGLSPEGIERVYPFREQLKDRYKFYKDNGRIEFITFHQSFSYEDFIEGIKPDLESKKSDIKYIIKDGIFKQICINAYYEIYRENKKRENIGTQKYDFDNLYLDFSSNLKRKLQENDNPISFKSKTNTDVILVDINIRGNLQLTTTSGARNYLVSKSRLRKLYENFATIDEIESLDNDIRNVIGGCNTTFYWTLFNELKKFENDGTYKAELSESELNEDITYETKKEIIEEFDFGTVSQNIISNAPKFVLIIDEINRGNIANIFGELITLIEKDKRGTNSESLDILLPYSKSSFSVPPNLFIIGTMNTADRSVESLDTALRRRFSFIHLPPEPDLISPQKLIFELWKKFDNVDWDEEPFKTKSQKIYEFLGASPELIKSQKSIYDKIPENWNDTRLDEYFQSINFKGIQPDKLLNSINYRIEKLLDHDHRIGHSYFMSLINCDNPEAELRDIFQNKIIPLLREYFYGDLGKIGLILGKEFVQSSSRTPESEIEFADFEHENLEELYEKVVYEIVPIDSFSIDSFIKIYSGIRVNE